MNSAPVTQRWLRLHLFGAFLIVFMLILGSSISTLVLRAHVETKMGVAEFIEQAQSALAGVELSVRSVMDVPEDWRAESARADLDRGLQALAAAREGMSRKLGDGSLGDSSVALVTNPTLVPLERIDELIEVTSPLAQRAGPFGDSVQTRFMVMMDVMNVLTPVLKKMGALERESLRSASRLSAIVSAVGLVGGFVAFGTIVAFILLPLERRILRAQEVILAKTEAAEAAAKAKSQFLATMSHEIRTPLNGVLGMANLLRRSPLVPEQVRMLDIILRSGQSLVTVIDDILDLTRMEARGVILQECAFDLRICVEDVATLFRPQAAAKSLRLTVDVASSVAENYIGDEDRLRQVLANLLSNAVKFTRGGGVALRVDNRFGKGGREVVVLSVADTGVGVPAEAQDRIFALFEQADSSTTREFGGTGLGLAIVKRIVDAMDGRVTLSSTSGRGATFAVELPLRRASGVASAPARGRAPLEAEVSEPLPAPGLRALVAEDNEVNRLVAEAMLRRLGCDVELVGDGQAAVARAKATRFDVVFMDVSMPRMNGLEATRALRSAEDAAGWVPTPVIGLSAHALPEMRARGREAGMSDFVTKPVTLEALREALGRLPRRAGPPAAPQEDTQCARPASPCSPPSSSAAAAAAPPPPISCAS